MVNVSLLKRKESTTDQSLCCARYTDL